jgi:heme-degrading monooxygenase HmoA
MIRVIYRWQVEPHKLSAFTQTWRRTTRRIHETVPGALGSFMLHAREDEAEILTIAKWRSMTDWQAFWDKENPPEMQAMRQLGERISVQVFDEVEDHTY